MYRIGTTQRKALTAVAATVATATLVATPAWAKTFFFSTGTIDGRLGALSQAANGNSLETETADDFVLTKTTSIARAAIVGVVPANTNLSDIENVEVEIYHVFPADSAEASGNVPSRTNSPADVEIGSATRDGNAGTLAFAAQEINPDAPVSNTVVNGIHAAPDNVTNGDGPADGKIVEITIVFVPPVVLPPDHYFFRPEVEVAGGDFLYLSAPKPIVPLGTPLLTDLQAWIRNSALKPDWLRIGTDVIADGTPPRTFNMTFSLTGATVPGAGIPGSANCHGKTVSALAHQFGGLGQAAVALGFLNVDALQDAFTTFCE